LALPWPEPPGALAEGGGVLPVAAASDFAVGGLGIALRGSAKDAKKGQSSILKSVRLLRARPEGSSPKRAVGG
jgi:hypothetical protein